MHFVKLILVAIAIEFMCSIGVLEKEKPKASALKVKMESIQLNKENDQKIMTEVPASTPIQIKIQ